jgi:hypothetical protein
MNKTFLTIILIIIFNNIFSQSNPIVVLDQLMDIRDEVMHVRAYKGEVLWIHIKTEERGGKRTNTLNNVKIFRQNASEEFQYIADKNDVDELSIRIPVPSDGIYTVVFSRGGLRRFMTNIVFQRDPVHSNPSNIERNAVLVNIPDTIHNYTTINEVYDHVRISTPKTKKERTPQFYEDQIFMDVAYALRIDNKYVIPVQMPLEILTEFKMAKSVEWGFTISVGDEVYKALQKRVAQVATASLEAGVGKALSGTKDATGTVKKTETAWEVFDKAATVNATAGITGDIGDQTDSKGLVVASDAVQVITGFTGLTELAGNKIAGFTPKISDKVKYEVLTQTEYRKYLNNEPYSTLAKGNNGYAQGSFEITNHRENYYIIIENGRTTSGGTLETLKSLGKTVLSQYVYTSVKVFVKRNTEVTYDKGYFENTFSPVTNPKYVHTQQVNTKQVVIFEDELVPYYQIINRNNIY